MTETENAVGGFYDPVASLHIALNQIVQQRDDARDALKRLHDFYEEAKARRNEYAATVERLRAALTTERQSVERFSAAHERTAERLRAGQPALPDVGPVTRDDGELMFGDGSHWHPASLDWREETALDVLARVHAARAFLDGEAADEGSDDEPDEVLVARALLSETGLVDAEGAAQRVLDAHRARLAGDAPSCDNSDEGHTPESFGTSQQAGDAR